MKIITKIITKALAAIMLMTMVAFVAGCGNGNGNNNSSSSEDKKATLSGSVGGHDYVDLGLPSGTLWATCNVGADTPEEYGDYFAWGETSPKSVYIEENYKYYYNGDENQLTKYNVHPNYGYNGFADGRTTLKPEDDVATANWGNGWRMPTKEQWEELQQNTTCQMTTWSGVNGWLVTASNGQSLFLPTAGFRLGDELYSAGKLGDSWSSSLCTNDSREAWYFGFPFGNYGESDYYRCYGRTVRPVRSAKD